MREKERKVKGERKKERETREREGRKRQKTMDEWKSTGMREG